MPSEVHEIQDESDFLAILEVQRAAFEEPYTKLWPLLCPELGIPPDARFTALSDGVARTMRLQKADPDSHWFKVTDTDSGQVVRAA